MSNVVTYFFLKKQATTMNAVYNIRIQVFEFSEVLKINYADLKYEFSCLKIKNTNFKVPI